MRVSDDADKEKTVFNAYGAGERGFELSWGVADDVAGLMLQRGMLKGFSGDWDFFYIEMERPFISEELQRTARNLFI